MRNIRLAARHWDHVMPIATKELRGFESYELDRRDSTPDLWAERELDGGETSLSRYVRARTEGDTSVTALPVFIMRGFRQRCIITTVNSPLETEADLAGKRIGLTGWADSGNTWTRAILRSAGVTVADAEWRVGALTVNHPTMDRIGRIDVPANVQPTEEDEPMTDMLKRGALDAVMTPFMPPGFYESGSPFRPLYRDLQAAEAAYYETTGYVPGIHVLAVQTRLLDDDASQAQRLTDLFDAAKHLSNSRRNKLLDVTPWHNEALSMTTKIIGRDWMPSGFTANVGMVDDFQTELIEQGLMAERMPIGDLFPHHTEPADTQVAA